jgi:predicted dehydrogenase
MKAVVQNLENGQTLVDDVPPPALLPDGILVRINRSLISLGTERAIMALAKKSPIGKAQDRPDLARKVINKAKQEGFLSTYKVVKNLMSSPIPLGYSCAGEVIDVGQNVTEFRTGDKVACAGLNYANHAEINYVPRNLAVKMPDGLSFESASFVTVGAIAMQGHRLANIELGDRVVVMGLGLVGQINAQLARCAGATVLVTDLDPHKVALAKKLGAHLAVSDPAELASAVSEFTDGYGADAVLICAATKSDDPIRQAAEISRLKGRVVAVGDVGMNLERRGYFEKEIELVLSRSYGPGRYDPAYEERGIDYPLPYVRWTEGRNMLSFLELVARNDIQVDPMITHSFPIEDAESAYKIVSGENKEPAVAIILEYKQEQAQSARVPLAAAPAKSVTKDKVNIGVIGAGQFAKGILLPAFAQQDAVRFGGFCTSSGLTSKHIAGKYNADFCTSDPDDIIGDDNIDAVLIATRHDQHAALATKALQAGKAVFTEKPLAITRESLLELCKVAEQDGAPRLMVGYNRRFAPLAVQCHDFFAPCQDGLFASYRVNAGHFPPESWVYDPVVGGGRILGEVCHFVDFLCYLTDSLPERITATELMQAGERAVARDNVSITLQMRDGSIGTIHYLANGDTSVSKEYVEVFGGRRTAILDNYRTLSMHQNNKLRKKRLLNQAKGFQQEVAAFINAVKGGGPMPIDWETLLAVTQTTFLIHRSLDSGGTVNYEAPTGQPAALDD